MIMGLVNRKKMKRKKKTNSYVNNLRMACNTHILCNHDKSLHLNWTCGYRMLCVMDFPRLPNSYYKPYIRVSSNCLILPAI